MVRPSNADARLLHVPQAPVAAPAPPRPATRAPLAVAAIVAVVTAGCVGKPAGTAGSAAKPQDPKEVAARLDRMMARENGPFAKHKVELLDGLSTGEIEGQSVPKTECKKDNDGSLLCAIDVDMGKDQDGDQDDIICVVSTKFEPFGPNIKDLLQDAGLQETPQVDVKPIGEGIAATFVANFAHETDTAISVGTMKASTLYAHGYMAKCFDRQAGGRVTFTRVVEAFFQSLKFKDRRDQPVAFAYGYKERSGDRTSGFRYGFISKDTESDPRFLEVGTFFTLNTDGKSWNVVDAGIETVRDKKGIVESTRELVWADGKGPAVLSAKPSEGGKFRLKFEAGPKSDALESTPQAPLTSELWSAADLAKVSAGTAPKYRYAVLDIADGDPTFRYITLTRSKPGVLLEEVEGDKKHKPAADADPQLKNKLEVDARGLVTKQVSSSSVMELVYTWGQLPAAGGKGK